MKESHRRDSGSYGGMGTGSVGVRVVRPRITCPFRNLFLVVPLLVQSTVVVDCFSSGYTGCGRRLRSVAIHTYVHTGAQINLDFSFWENREFTWIFFMTLPPSENGNNHVFHHVPIGGSWWNLYPICVLVMASSSIKGEVIGSKVKGHGSILLWNSAKLAKNCIIWHLCQNRLIF